MSVVDAGKLSGLTSERAKKLLSEVGPNELPKLESSSLFRTILSVLEEPMIFLLLTCGGLYILLGKPEEAVALCIAVIAVISITIFQKNKTETALDSLRDLSIPFAVVIRDSIKSSISAKEIVPGDLVFIREGERIPADGFLVQDLNLQIDESLISGESVPVVKRSLLERTADDSDPLVEDSSRSVYASCLVVAGEGIFTVTATGSSSLVGKIGQALGKIQTLDTPLQRQAKKLTLRITIFAAVFFCLIVAGLGVRTGNWLEAFLAGLTFSMAILPEEIPIILTIYLSLGAWRISKVKVLTRTLGAIETLGAATILCVDKTGTLTENKMEVRKLYVPNSQGGSYLDCNSNMRILPEEFHSILEFSLLASKQDPFDPMEKGIRNLGILTLAGTEHLHTNWDLEKEYPLSDKLAALSYAWKQGDNQDLVIGTKGAPEAIFDLCHLDADTTANFSEIVERLSSEGLRILGVAKANIHSEKLPSQQHDFIFEFLGLVCLEDPVRREVPESISKCIGAGIKVVMITGDHLGTAKSIAKKAGIPFAESVLTGADLNSLNDEALSKRVEEVGIFSRITPDQKLRIVQAFQSNGEIVAMTGDGVNDAPALKAAHIGISMGKRGTAVAREASDIVLLDDSFSALVDAISLGRRIYDNIRKGIIYVLSVHVPIVGMSLLPAIFAIPLFLFPAHVLFLELIIDPACSLIFEGEEEEKNGMHRPPRASNDSIIDLRTGVVSLVRGLVSLIAVLFVYFYAKYQGFNQEESRTLGFICIISGNVFLILTNLSWTEPFYRRVKSISPIFYILLLFVLIFMVSTIKVEFLTRLFGFAQVKSQDAILVTIIGILSVLWWEILKSRTAALKIAKSNTVFSRNAS
ncbi:putative calcium-translocating P-type ATPase, PMCA-type [Leptospira fainei serovar Hurstbridge str. BUT 6]|uniref:Calcium-translocating P-type ATPase, PMCA-type n=1 Tax=Leptospira fainei serovar Hurstbridge str. BUT 6 TaxID=1193011 RepID=S3VWQ3_9LEPT|nr:cation-translocating P-type ATPase [Leptospira fainei]EPG72542.1 putative calcium-translocating P-type ATPase, PMCA-type [Leptospira fainei serovar Hurstbridge str. BUT 6]